MAVFRIKMLELWTLLEFKRSHKPCKEAARKQATFQELEHLSLQGGRTASGCPTPSASGRSGDGSRTPRPQVGASRARGRLSRRPSRHATSIQRCRRNTDHSFISMHIPRTDTKWAGKGPRKGQGKGKDLLEPHPEIQPHREGDDLQLSALFVERLEKQ